MKVIILPSAASDLRSIGGFIDGHNARAALSMVRALRKACVAISVAPRGFPVVDRYKNQEVRRKPYKRYLIFYRVLTDRIEILRILHGARDYDRLLSPDG